MLLSEKKRHMPEYIITNGNGSYIKHNEFSGKFSEVRNLALATSWPTHSRANNIWKNALTKKQKAQFYVKECVNGLELSAEDPVPSDNEGAESADESGISFTNDLHIDAIKQLCQESVADSCVDELENLLTLFATFVDKKLSQKDALTIEHSQVEKEIVDIEHYIEFHNLNAYQGWLVFKLFQQRLRKRRAIKDSIQAISNLETCNIDTEALRRAAMRTHRLKDRRYEPRALPELFE